MIIEMVKRQIVLFLLVLLVGIFGEKSQATDTILSHTEAYLPPLFEKRIKSVPAPGFNEAPLTKVEWDRQKNQFDSLYSDFPTGKMSSTFGYRLLNTDLALSHFEFCEHFGFEVRCVYTLRDKTNKPISVVVATNMSREVQVIPYKSSGAVPKMQDVTSDRNVLIGLEKGPTIVEGMNELKGDPKGQIELSVSREIAAALKAQKPDARVFPVQSFEATFNLVKNKSTIHAFTDFNMDGKEDLIFVALTKSNYEVVGVLSGGTGYKAETLYSEGLQPDLLKHDSNRKYRKLDVCSGSCEIFDKSLRNNTGGSVGLVIARDNEKDFNGAAFYWNKVKSSWDTHKFSQR